MAILQQKCRILYSIKYRCSSFVENKKKACIF